MRRKEAHQVADVIVLIRSQGRIRYDQTEDIALAVVPGGKGDVGQRVGVHDRVLCPASLPIFKKCQLSSPTGLAITPARV